MPMSRPKKFLTIGVWVIILPYLGFPANVKNILFIASGAFLGLTDVVSERLKSGTSIGFKDQAASAKAEFEQADLLRQVRPQDIIKYGFMPELVGRFPNINNYGQANPRGFLGDIEQSAHQPVRALQNLFRPERY